HGELGVALVADIAGDGYARVDADPEAYGFAQDVSERVVQRLDPLGDRGAGSDRLPARGFRPAAHAEQRQKSVAQDLVRLSAGGKNRAAHGVKELVDDEYGVEGQASLGQPARSAHVDEHDDDVALDSRVG